MSESRLFLSPPHMSGRELQYVEEAFQSNYIAPVGPMLDRFERQFSEYVGIPHVVALSSGTSAIHLALKALEFAPDDEVWAATLTFIGGIAPVVHERLTPVFLDCDEKSWTLDCDILEEELRAARRRGKLPRAIIPTDLYGNPCDMARMSSICAEHGVAIICDSAEAVGTRMGDRHAGYGAYATAFSFNGNKILTTSGGGMLASQDRKVIDLARYLSTQARDPVPHYEHRVAGYNYRLSNICAAIGVGQLETLEDRVARRRAIFELYRSLLQDIPGLSFMPQVPGTRLNHWLTVIQLDPAHIKKKPEAIRQALEAHNIEARPVWKPMHQQSVFAGARCYGGKVADRLFRDGLCLPSGSQMTDADVTKVATLIRAAL